MHACSPPHVAILGAGPAGMSCANACLSFGLAPVVIEATDHVGGTQRSNFHPNLWLLGHPQETGEQMTRRLAEHFLRLELTLHLGSRVQAVARQDPGFGIELITPQGPLSLQVRAIVLATGMRPRATPELAHLAARSRRVIIGPLSSAIRDEIAKAKVLILGGGDNALDHALFLAERANTVRVCTRRRFSARQPFQAACAAQPQIELMDHCLPERIELDAQGRPLVYWGGQAQGYDWLLVMYGYQPNTEVLAHFDASIRPQLTQTGHVQVDGWQRTTVPGLYAAGDVTFSPQPSVASAIAQGLAAARAIERDLTALQECTRGS